MFRPMENGIVNLIAIVSMEVFCLIAVPVILLLGTKRKGTRQEEE
jgi:hypothetical protein